MRFSLTRFGDGYRLKRRGPRLELIDALVSYLLAQGWSEPEFVLRDEPVLSAAELHVLYCVLTTPRLMLTSERAFWTRFGFYRESTESASYALAHAAAELDDPPSGEP